MTKEISFDRMVWANWEQRFLEEEEQVYREQTPEEPTQEIPLHELMDAKEVCAKKRWSLSKLCRNVRSRKLAYIKEDGKMWFRRADVKRYEKKSGTSRRNEH